MAADTPAASRNFSGSRLREYREKRGMTQLQVAVAIGKTPGTVYNWEAGKSVPDAEDLGKLETLLGVRIDKLFE